MKEPLLLIQQLHQEYCTRTSYKLMLSADRRAKWQTWLDYNPEEPFTLQDLKEVIVYLRAQIRDGKRMEGALRFPNLLAPDRFEEDLQVARAWCQSRRRQFGGGSTKPKATPSATKAQKEDDERVSLDELEEMKKEAGLQ